MTTFLVTLRCAEPGCAAAQQIAVKRSGLNERLAAIRSVDWEPDEDNYIDVWCPKHAERDS